MISRASCSRAASAIGATGGSTTGAGGSVVATVNAAITGVISVIRRVSLPNSAEAGRVKEASCAAPAEISTKPTARST